MIPLLQMIANLMTPKSNPVLQTRRNSKKELKSLLNKIVITSFTNTVTFFVCCSIQLLVEQRVEQRLREIFEELKKGHKPLMLLREQYLRNQYVSLIALRFTICTFV